MIIFAKKHDHRDTLDRLLNTPLYQGKTHSKLAIKILKNVLNILDSTSDVNRCHSGVFLVLFLDIYLPVGKVELSEPLVFMVFA